jgi:hypothetical protein
LETRERAASTIFNENAAKVEKVLIETLENLLMRISIRATLQPNPEV